MLLPDSTKPVRRPAPRSLPSGLLLAGLLLAACGAEPPPAAREARTPRAADVPAASAPEPAEDLPPGLDPAAFEALDGRVVIDGSSTVFPITEAVSALFGTLAPEVAVSLGVSGTGGGFAKFCRGRTDISDASRPIKTSEARLCRRHGVDFVELPVAFDGLSVVVHGGNDWCACLSVDELARLWRPEAEGEVTRWNQLRPQWPDRPIQLYAPGRDSGTFDYFTHAIVGTEGSSRGDFVGSEDDYLLAQDISKDPGALGFFGYAYYHEYRDRLRLVAVDGGAGCVLPDETAIVAGRYRPLSRPIFIYVSTTALSRPAVARFVDLYLAAAPRLVPRVSYVPLPERAYRLAERRLAQRRTGSIFTGGSEVGVSIEQLLELEAGDEP